MQSVTLEKAQTALADLVQKVAHGEQFTITQNGEPKAVLSAVEAKRGKAKAGSLKGKIWISEDFDAPLEDFKQYMQ
jgi:prevent-host-death family protein